MVKKTKDKWSSVSEFANELNKNAANRGFNASFALGRLVEKVFEAEGEEINTEAVGFHYIAPEDDGSEEAD